MPNKSFGQKLQIGEHILVGDNDEIHKDSLLYIFNRSTATYDVIWDKDWEAFLAGDVSKLKEEIQNQFPEANVRWLNFAWDKTTQSDPFFDVLEMRWKFAYHVYGFKIEAIVENTGNSFTALQILAIIIGFAFAVVIVGSFALGAWGFWEVLSAAKRVGDWATILIGLLLIGGVAVFLLLLLGVGFKGKRGKTEVSAKK